MKKEIRHVWFYKQPVEKVWAYLTQAELIEKWLMPNDFVLEVGHEFTFKTNPIPQLSLNGTFYCQVLVIVHLEKLVYTWKGGMEKAKPTLDTRVEWTLESKIGGTELRLHHSGFTSENLSILEAMTGGWNEHIQKMMSNLNQS